MGNVHEGCEYYVPERDMCMMYSPSGFFNMSEEWPDDCVDHFYFAASDESFTKIGD